MKFSGNLARVCRRAFEGIIVDPPVRIKRVSVVRSDRRGCRHTDSETCLIVRVFTNDASMLKGAAQAYKGSYKERVEGAIDFFVRAANPAAHAHLEIIGPESLSVERLVPIKKLLQFGKLGPRSPIAIAGQSYGINYCLIRGRHLIGPCPAVSVVLRRLLSREKENIRTVLDIFSGTGLATKVVCLHGHPKEVTVIDNDERKISRMKSHMGSLPVQLKVADAFQYQFEKEYDLVVADPYFEDSLGFVDRKIGEIVTRAKIFVLVSGATQDATWNRRVRRKLIDAGMKVKKYSEFGETVFVARK